MSLYSVAFWGFAICYCLNGGSNSMTDYADPVLIFSLSGYMIFVVRIIDLCIRSC